MKRVIFLIMLASFFFLTQGASAHTLKIDGNIGVNLHVDPDDAPQAGNESKFLVDIQDKSGRFNVSNPENCDCKLTIAKKGEVLKVLSVTTGGMYNQLRYTFPESAMYHVTIEGKSNGKGVAFQSFKTTFEYFVKPGATESIMTTQDRNPLLVWMPYVALGVGISILLMFVL